jgi:uncharacterized protein (DUF2147 family)
MKKTNAFIMAVMVLTAWISLDAVAQKHKPDDVVGTWLNEERTAKVQIFKEGDKYFGKIVWLKETLDKVTGKPRTDNLNPDVNQREKPLMGLMMLKSFVFNGEDEWKDGTIYDPKNGKTYSCYIKFETPVMLKIRGYIGISMLGRTTHWYKANM